MRITVIGSVFIDMKGFPDNKYIPNGRNVGSIEIDHGGAARNVAENLARCGIATRFVSNVDDTAIGGEIIQRLSDNCIDTAYIERCENGCGMWLAVFNDTNNVVGQISRQPKYTSLEQLAQTKGDEIISSCDAVILEFDTTPLLAETFTALAKKYNKPLYIIVGNMEIVLKERSLLKEISCVVCNDNEAGRLFGMSDLEQRSREEILHILCSKAPEAGIRSMIITLGSRGAVYYDAAESGICEPMKCTVADTTGAGDAFLSGVVMALSAGLPLSKAAQAGTRLAVKVIETVGNTCPVMKDFL